MKTKRTLRTIENHLGLKLKSTLKIEKNPILLAFMKASAAMIPDKKGEGATILIQNENDLEALSEELTHILDRQTGRGVRIRHYNKDTWGSLSYLDHKEYHEDRFYDNVLTEALGYYGSKIITPARKPSTLKPRLKKYIETKNWEQLKKIYLKKSYNEQAGYPIYWYIHKEEDNVQAWHEIGYDLGEKIYDYVQKTGKKDSAIALIRKNRGRKVPFELYKKILERATR